MNTRALTLAFRMGTRQAVTQPMVVVGQLVIFTALVVSYGAILRVVPQADLDRLGLTAPQLVWYLVVTETVAMVGTGYFRHLQRDIRSGLVDIWLLRPIEFWPLLIAEWAGQEIPRLLPVATAGIVLARIISGSWGFDAGVLAMLVPTVIASTMIVLCWCFLIGVSSIWVGESRPMFWLYQKALFVLGALLWPLAFYPGWLRSTVWLTPFPAILATPGSLMLHPGVAMVLSHAAAQLFWLSFYVFLCDRVAKFARVRLAR